MFTIRTSSHIRFEAAQVDLHPLSEAANVLVRRASVLVTIGTVATMAAVRANNVVPIVMVGVADPVTLGLVRSLAKPGGTVTGVSLLGQETLEKSLDLLLAAAPGIARPAVLWNPANPGAELGMRHMRQVAERKKLDFVSVPVEQSEHVDARLQDLRQTHHDALLLVNDPLFVWKADSVLAYCSDRRLPGLFSAADWVFNGGLLSYQPEATETYRRTASYVARILSGGQPKDLPVEQPTKFEFVFNLRTAKALGLTIPPSLLQRADQVIE